MIARAHGGGRTCRPVERTEISTIAVQGSASYAGMAYRWRALVMSAEVEKANDTRYGFRIGTRF